MEEGRVDKLNQWHLEEMTFVQIGAVWDRRWGCAGSARYPYSSFSSYIWQQIGLGVWLLLTLWLPMAIDFQNEVLAPTGTSDIFGEKIECLKIGMYPSRPIIQRGGNTWGE